MTEENGVDELDSETELRNRAVRIVLIIAMILWIPIFLSTEAGAGFSERIPVDDLWVVAGIVALIAVLAFEELRELGWLTVRN